VGWTERSDTVQGGAFEHNDRDRSFVEGLHDASQLPESQGILCGRLVVGGAQLLSDPARKNLTVVSQRVLDQWSDSVHASLPEELVPAYFVGAHDLPRFVERFGVVARPDAAQQKAVDVPFDHL